jgi:riboflavin kinase/FMN adenylyltransferase
MKVAAKPSELEAVPRAVAVGMFDGVHRGHRAVIDELRGTGLRSTVITFDPHPRTVLGREVELLTTVQRRLELLADAGVEETLVVSFTAEVAALSPEGFAQEILLAIGTEIVVFGENFRFGRARAGDAGLLRELGLQTREVQLAGGISSTAIRMQIREGDVGAAATLLGRPVEVDGTVVGGDRRGGVLGYPTANLDVDPDLLVPAYGIYAGAVGDQRAAISIGVNPHYGGSTRRIEAFLLDWSGDLYGERVVLEVWQRLRDEQAFEGETALVAQIARDVEQTRAAVRPAS